jgi:hypothetical protein
MTGDPAVLGSLLLEGRGQRGGESTSGDVTLLLSGTRKETP